VSLTARIRALEPSATLAIDSKAKALKAAGEPVIGFAAGEPDFATPAHIVEAARRAAGDTSLHRYTPAVGLLPLREAIVARAARDGLTVTVDQVCVANGGKHALYNTFMALIEPGDEVIVTAPYWVSYPEQIKLAGGVFVPVVTDAAAGFRADVAQLEAVRTKRTKALVFVSPSNPTGAVYPPEEVAAIARWAAENGIWIITDEIYRHLVYGDARFATIPALVPEAAERTVIIDGVAKAYAMTGWRIGWSIAPLEIAQGIAKLQSQLSANVSNISQAAAIEALTGPQEAVEEMRLAFDRRRRLAVDALSRIPGLELAEPEGAFYVFPSVAALMGTTIAGRRIDTTMELADLLLEEAKVAIVPGEAFGAPGAFRLSYALADADLLEGIDRIARLLGS